MDKKRCNNFTSNEIDVLLSLVEEVEDIVECKKTDTVNNNRKDLEWNKIEMRFNAVCATARTAKMLRSKWDSLKKSTKKEYAEHKQRLYKTGGGPGGSGVLSAISSRILAIVGIGVTGTSSQFDSDFDLCNNETERACDNFNLVQAQPSTRSDETMPTISEPEITIDKISLDESEILSSSTWKSWNPQQLRQPKSRALKVSESNDADLCSEDHTEVETEPTQKTPLKLETPQCSSDIKKIKRLNRVEPIASVLKKKRALSEQSSHEELLKKKIALIDLQTQILQEERTQKRDMIDTQIKILKEEADQKRRQLAEKHELEMKILLVELQNKEIQLG